MNLTPYRLIAYELETGKEVLNWPNVAEHRYSRGDTILEGDDALEVLGVRKASTEQLLLIDVRRVSGR